MFGPAKTDSRGRWAITFGDLGRSVLPYTLEVKLMCNLVPKRNLRVPGYCHGGLILYFLGLRSSLSS